MSPSLLTTDSIFKRYPEVEYHLHQIVKKLSPEQVVLFGSKARGSAGSTSDTDMAVVMDAFMDTTDIYGALDIVDLKKASEKLKNRIYNEGIVIYDKEKGITFRRLSESRK